MHDLAEQLISELRTIWRYRWYAVILAWILALAGWTYVYLKPDQYEAYTRVYVDTQSVLRPLMKGLAVEPDLDQMVTMMSRTLISRPNLERVVQMTRLDNGLKSDEERNQLLGIVAERISIKSAGTKNLYRISYVDENPQVAKRVVEAFLELFVQRSRGEKREDADSARAFIDQQLENYRRTLTESEDAIMAFKREHLGLLPGEGPNFFARLVDTQNALRKAELELKEAENSADSIRRQLATASRNLSRPQDDALVAPALPESELDARISALEKKLDDLRLTYTEEHPDVVAIIPMIDQLKQRKVEELERLRRERDAEAKLVGEGASAAELKDPVYQELTVALTKAEANVAVLRTRAAEYRRRYAELRAAANAVPQVEAEYTQLTRDYEVNKARYDELLKRRESAEISGDLEETDAVMGFRVIDPPRLPLFPTGPGRHIMATLVLLAAIGGGIGGAWLIGQMRPTVVDERKLKEISGLPMLGTVVMAWTEAQKKRRKRGLVALSVSIASLLSAYAAVIATFMLAASRV